MRIGAHVRTPGGLRTAVDNARAVGADAVQLFLSNPRSWAGPRPETAERFGAEWREAGIGPLYVHAPYLVNIASPNPDFVVKSLELCRRSVVACAIAGAAIAAQRRAVVNRRVNIAISLRPTGPRGRSLTCCVGVVPHPTPGRGPPQRRSN